MRVYPIGLVWYRIHKNKALKLCRMTKKIPPRGILIAHCTKWVYLKGKSFSRMTKRLEKFTDLQKMSGIGNF